jgi:hypothetical protein
MSILTKITLGGALFAALLLGGCASRYDDGYGTYYDSDGTQHWRHGEHWDRDRDDVHDGKKVRVCDADGSDCHWEYRER